MSTRKLFVDSAIFLLVGLVSLWSKWNGNTGVTAGDTISAWSVTFNGSVHGWPAMIGVVAVLAAAVAFLWGLVRVLLEEPTA
ncbi:MAG TPA: hypothetical protein VN620_04270 [Candidatus Methylomirabilis sp.]|nr:hypothetical protein [Candidatus Methylomirabilis sp.]